MSEDRTKSLVTNVAPAWLTQYATKDTSLDNLREYRVLERLQMVQDKMKNQEFAALGVGSAGLVPSNTLVCEQGEAFEFTPVFMYTEFIKWRDRDDLSGNKIIEKSTEKFGNLAKRARNDQLRYEEYPSSNPKKPFSYYYAEVLNFACVISSQHAPELESSLVVIPFMKGEFFNGKAFCSKIQGRKLGDTQVPLYLQRWRATVGVHRDNKGHTWWGLDISNPEQPYVEEQKAEVFKGLFLEMNELTNKNAVGTDYTDIEEVDATVVQNENSATAM